MCRAYRGPGAQVQVGAPRWSTPGKRHAQPISCAATCGYRKAATWRRFACPIFPQGQSSHGARTAILHPYKIQHIAHHAVVHDESGPPALAKRGACEEAWASAGVPHWQTAAAASQWRWTGHAARLDPEEHPCLSARLRWRGATWPCSVGT